MIRLNGLNARLPECDGFVATSEKEMHDLRPHRRSPESPGRRGRSISTPRLRPTLPVPQIGSVQPKAIIAGRPYRGKVELVSNKIISQRVYEKIHDKFIAK